MWIRFQKTINVEQRTFKSGAEIDADELLAGTVESLLNTGAAVEIEEPLQAVQPEADAGDEGSQPQAESEPSQLEPPKKPRGRRGLAKE